MEEGKMLYAWLDGEMVPWGKACLHVNTQCVLGGLNAYEVTQAHWNKHNRELFLFRLDEHLNRISRTIKIMRINTPFSLGEFKEASLELMNKNNHKEDALIRLVVYIGEGPFFAIEPEEIKTGAFIISFPAKRTIPPTQAGLHCGTTSWNRATDDTVPPRVKVGANYQNLRLAFIQAKINGYDAPILLNRDGRVAESHLRNIFLVNGEEVITPSITSGILEGITRMSLLEVIPNEMGLKVKEREINKTELYTADEVFLCGSAKDEIVRVLSVDGYQVGSGSPGRVTKELTKVFEEITFGKNQKYLEWLTPVYG